MSIWSPTTQMFYPLQQLQCLMYADDTTIYFNTEQFSNGNLQNEISNELSKLNTWLKQKWLSHNADKTKYMIFHARQCKITTVPISMNGK